MHSNNIDMISFIAILDLSTPGIKYINIDLSAALLHIETILRGTFQQEIMWNEKLVEAITENGSHDHPKTREIREKLDALNKEYWLLERDWWGYRSGFIEGPLTRGFDLWRSNPRWYMHRFLVEDCAGRGGCCGRSCGCCLHREMSPARKLGVGHCTGDCGCCIKTRGFVLNTEDKKKLDLLFGISLENEDLYYHRIIWASIWGLPSSSHNSPISDHLPVLLHAWDFDTM
jgi:hypothetical protein